MSAVDITDAFLTVTQIEPTLVACGARDFALGKVLPDRGLAVRCGTVA